MFREESSRQIFLGSEYGELPCDCLENMEKAAATAKVDDGWSLALAAEISWKSVRQGRQCRLGLLSKHESSVSERAEFEFTRAA